MTGQVIGGGGINPVSMTKNIAIKAVAPVIRDLTAATASGIGAGVGKEVASNIDTGNDSANAAIDAGLTMLGGVTPGVVGASRGTAGDRSAAALKGVTQAQIARAKSLQQKAADAGTPLTAYEAIQAVTGQNPKMQTQQRLAEQSDAGQTTLVPMMQQRPTNNASMAERRFEAVSPMAVAPDALAGRLRAAATEAIDSARQHGNDLAQPYYAASSNNPANKVPSQTWNMLASDDGVVAALRAVKADPYSGLQSATEGSLQWLDMAKRKLDGQIEAAKRDGNAYLVQQLGSARAKIVSAADTSFPAYAKARSIVEQNNKDIVGPMRDGQLGKLSQSDDFRQQAGTLLPNAPMDVNPTVVHRTMTAIGAQDPEIGSQFLGQYLRGNFNEANQKTVGGDNVFGGAKFSANVAGNPIQEANLIQALRSSGGDAAAIQDALAIFRAQGMKPPVNSATSSNLNEGSLLNGRKLADALRAVPGAVDSWRNGWATKQLAGALANPTGIETIEELARVNGTYNPVTQQVLANALRAYGVAQPKTEPSNESLIKALREQPDFVGLSNK